MPRKHEGRTRVVQCIVPDELYDLILQHRERMNAALPLANRGVSVSAAACDLLARAFHADGTPLPAKAVVTTPEPDQPTLATTFTVGAEGPSAALPCDRVPRTVSRDELLRAHRLTEGGQSNFELQAYARVWPRTPYIEKGKPGHSCALCGPYHGSCPECGAALTERHNYKCPWHIIVQGLPKGTRR